MQLSREQTEAVTVARTGKNLFMTGGAGTGKTVALRRIIEALPARSTLVTASTGLAAVNIGGRTIHSVLGIDVVRDIEELRDFERTEVGLKKRDAASKILKNIKTICIDEISMISGDLLEVIDQRLREVTGVPDRPMGGIQMIFVGDFGQLPPVFPEDEKPPKSRFVFEAKAWPALDLQNAVLTSHLRQTEQAFCAALDQIRLGILTEFVAKLFDARVVADEADIPNSVIRIVPTRKQAADINNRFLNEVEPFASREVHKFFATIEPAEPPHGPDSGLSPRAYWEKHHAGSFVADQVVLLKVGVPAVVTANLDFDRGIVNGRQVVVKDIKEKEILCEATTGEVFSIHVAKDRHTWEQIGPDGKVIASITQIPLKLAFALTAHKAQGMTLDRVHVILNGNFSAGQVYSMLSRVRTLGGLTMDRPLDPKRDIKVSPECKLHIEKLERQLVVN